MTAPSATVRLSLKAQSSRRGVVLLLCILCARVQAQGPTQPPLLPVEVRVEGLDLSLFPTPGKPETIIVRLCRHVPEAGSVRCRIVLDNFSTQPTCGYAASGEVTVALEEPEKWYQAALTISMEAAPLAMTTGKVVVRGRVGERSVSADVPLRIGRGALAFLERRTIQFPEGPRAVDVACLENPQLRAEFIPERGCLSAFIPRRTRHDLLVEGPHPVGIWWDGAGKWYHRSFPKPGPTVKTEFTAGAGERTIVMRATLGEADDFLGITYSTGTLPAPPGMLYVTTTPGVQGADRISLQWQGSTQTWAPVAQAQKFALSGPPPGQLQFRNAKWLEALEVSFSAPMASLVHVGSKLPWYNYAALQFRDGPPGSVELRVRALRVDG